MEKTAVKAAKLLKLKIKSINLEIIDNVLPYLLTIICIASASLIKSDLIVFSICIASLSVYIWRRYDARIFIGASIFSLLTCAMLLAAGCEKNADRAAILTYYFLVVGVIGLLVNYLREGEDEK